MLGAFVLGIVISISSFLFFGDSQWSKYIYIFQCYYLKRGGSPGRFTTEQYLPVPDGYTGIFIGWHENGTINFIGEYTDGVRSGVQIAWYDDGKSRSFLYVEDGEVIFGFDPNNLPEEVEPVRRE